MASGGPIQSPDDNRVHMFRLQILIIDGGLLVFRNLVDKTLADKGMTLSECLDNEKSTIDTLKRKGIIKKFQYDILFPHGKNPLTTDMDITLLMCLLRNLELFSSIDEADLNLLRNSRNKLSHMTSTTEIQEKEFKDMWTDIEQMLVRHSTPELNIQKIIAGYKICPLDHEREKMVQKEIEKWRELEAEIIGVKEEVAEVKKKMTEVEGGVTKVEKEMTGLKQDFTQVKEGLDNLKTGDYHKQTKEEIYQSRKAELQGDLIKFYRKRCSSISLSPLLEEIETPLAGFYVMPDIVDVTKTSSCAKEERTPIKSLKDLFSTKSRVQQEIYLSADAGFGKTAFSKYLAITWCQAHCPDENLACFKDDQLKTLFDFEILFLILLRDCTSVCKIDNMIIEQVTNKLPSSALLDEVSHRARLDEVLRREKCLIILDGLDEWTHPDNSCSEKIPHRYVRDNCVILTTTRPWKLGVSNLKTSQMDKKVELVQLSKDSMLKLEENALRKMTGVHDDSVLISKMQDFNGVIRKHGLYHMQVVPLLLMYILCLWCDEIPIRNSKHEVYTNIIEFLLSRTSHKHPEVQPSRESSASKIPEYFKRHKYCKQFYSLITSLAELAYQTLFNDARENTLVFDRTVAEKYLNNADDLKLSLLSGILSESRSKTLIKEIIKVSFSHKTVQEFFAAIFISSQSDAQKTVLEKCKNIEDILEMSNIYEFISRMNAHLMCAISNDLMSVINEDETTRCCRTMTDYEFLTLLNNPLFDIQKLFMSCLQEMPEGENIQLCLQDFFIDQSTVHSDQLQRLLKQNKTNIKLLEINTRGTSSSLREIIDLFSHTDLSHIQTLYYYGVKKEEAEINLILFPGLQYVTLLRGQWTNDEENPGEKLALVQNLQYLNIGRFTLSHKIQEAIFNFISGHKSMKVLELNSLGCKEHGRHDCKRWNLDLSQHSTLSKLELMDLPVRLQLNIATPSLVDVDLSYINLDESSLLLSRDMLNINHVMLSQIEMSAGSLQKFITVLENLPQSVTVKMKGIKPNTEYKRFRENIWSSQTFHVIHDDMRGFKFKTRENQAKDKQKKKHCKIT